MCLVSSPQSPALPLLPHVTMAAPLDPVSDPGTEVSLLELNQELQSKLEASQQDFRDLREKFLVSEATAYSLANQLQKYSKSYKVRVTKVMTVCIPGDRNWLCVERKRRPSPDFVFSISIVTINSIVTTIQEK